jgi:hypothetical protein
MLPYTYWMKNLVTTTVYQLALAQMLFLTRVLGYTLVDDDTEVVWDAMLTGLDGSVSTLAPQHFAVTTAVFTGAHVNKWLTVRDPLNPRNSGIFTIVSVDGDGMGCVLQSPMASFVANASSLSWSVYNPTATIASPPIWAVVGRTTTTGDWQVRITASATDLTYTMSPNGGWNTSTDAFTQPVLPDRILTPLNIAANLAFAVGSDQGGWATFWCDNGGVCTAINLGRYATLHNPGILGQPSDTLPVTVVGSSGAQVGTNCSRLPATANSLAADATTLGNDKFTATSVKFMQWLWATLGTDPLSTGANTVLNDPRTGQPDAVPITLCTPTSISIRGNVQGLYAVNDALTNRTLLSAGTVYVLQNGIAVPWDTSTPI